MTAEELQKVIEEQKAQGASEEDIAGKFYLMFCEEKISVDELDNVLSFLGMELTPEFKQMSPEEQMKQGFEKSDSDQDGEDVSNEEQGEDADDNDKSDGNPNEKEDKEDKGEEDEESKAMRLMGLSK